MLLFAAPTRLIHQMNQQLTHSVRTTTTAMTNLPSSFTNFTYFLGDNNNNNSNNNHINNPPIDNASSHFEDISPISSHIITITTSTSTATTTSLSPYPTISMTTYVIVTLLLWASTVILAMMIRDLGIVNSLTGVIAASTIGYTLPGLLYLCTNAKEGQSLWEVYKQKIRETWSGQQDNSTGGEEEGDDGQHEYHEGLAIIPAYEQDDDDHLHIIPQKHTMKRRSRRSLQQHYPRIVWAVIKLCGEICYVFRYFVFALFLIVFGLLLLIMGIITIFMNNVS